MYGPDASIMPDAKDTYYASIMPDAKDTYYASIMPDAKEYLLC